MLKPSVGAIIMRRPSLRAISVVLIASAISAGGCAGRPQQNTLKEYQEMMNKQKKAALAAQEEEAANKAPDMTADRYERLGDQYLSQGDLDLAFIQYSKSLRLDPRQPRIHYKRGRLFLKKELYEEGKKEFQSALDVDPRYAAAHEGVGRACYYLGEEGEAERHFRQALSLDQRLWQARNFLGIIYDRRKEFHRAISEYEIAISLKDDVPMLFNNLGMSLFLKGDHERAARAFADALKLKNADKKIHNNLALALCKTGRSREALEAFRKGGSEPSAQYDLGRICVAEGKAQEDREAIKTSRKTMEPEPACYFAAHKSLKRADPAD
jgi:Flp pilus assembly protein TadD